MAVSSHMTLSSSVYLKPWTSFTLVMSSLRKLGLGVSGGGLVSSRHDGVPVRSTRSHPYTSPRPPVVPSSSSSNPPPPSGKESSVAPVAPAKRSTKLGKALEVASDPDLMERALQDLEKDKFAATCSSSRDNWWRTWCRLHDAAALGGDAVPLTVRSINHVAALFKAAGFVSYSNYAHCAKSEHIATMHRHGLPWTDDLEQALRDTKRSVTRGAGGSRQSSPLNIEKVWALGVWEDPLVTDGPIGPTDFLVAGTFFLMREIELAAADVGNVRLDIAALVVSWRLPTSKTDPRALGTERSWGCLCQAGKDVPCPYHALVRQLGRVQGLAQVLDADLNAMPLFPDEDGYRITKGASIATIVEAARRSGELVLTPAGAQQFGGHSLRTGGASMLARWGLNPFRIQSLGRWRSNLVIHYSGSAMSHGATEEARALLQLDRSSNPETVPPALRKLVKDVEAKLAKAEAKEAQHEAMLNAARQSKTASMAVIRNDDNAKVHRGIERSEAAACEGTTTCG